MMVVLWFSLDRAVFHSPLTLLAFYAVLLPLSLASYRYFEHPVQRFLRRELGGRLRGRTAAQRVS
jgi:peptidoglycan/LPS O-acetylase OafA/YrhL